MAAAVAAIKRGTDHDGSNDLGGDAGGCGQRWCGGAATAGSARAFGGADRASGGYASHSRLHPVGLSSDGEGAHDYPQFSADWSKLLTDKGALVDGSFHFPAPELANTDVMVMYKGDAGYMTASEKQVLEDYLKRGGGLVSIHDTLCGDDPQYYASIVGGSKLHGERNFSSGAINTRSSIGVADHEGHVGFRDRRRSVLQDHVGEIAGGQGPRHCADARGW